MSIANLPMYDLPEAKAYADAWWAGLGAALSRAGVSDVPSVLLRSADFHALWRDADLLIGQTCGYPLMEGLYRDVTVLGTPCYDAEGCEGPNFSSAIVARQEDSGADLSDFRGRVAAFNSVHSQSGFNAFRHSIAPLARAGQFFSATVETGGHGSSLEAVGSGQADIASIDCVTFALMQDYRPALVADLTVIAWTEKAPGLPLITRKSATAEDLAQLRDGLQAAFSDEGLAPARKALRLKDIAWLGLDDYEAILAMEQSAEAMGYPQLA